LSKLPQKEAGKQYAGEYRPVADMLCPTLQLRQTQSIVDNREFSASCLTGSLLIRLNTLVWFWKIFVFELGKEDQVETIDAHSLRAMLENHCSRDMGKSAA
jgi:hypothetical protein